ncbi:MAG: MFS transporter [Clostridiaceae bacterium]|jgi:DHA3 family macrolide efflux protein-like MFS transporter|nr:MFS transporter [Clostridiaceae bacterium]
MKKFAPWQYVLTAFYSGQAASTLGTALVQFALIWYVTFRTNSGLALTIMTIASFLPQLLIALVSGVWADRYDRRWVIILADGGIALASLIVSIFFIKGFESIWLIFLVSAIRSLGGGIQGPAINALIPQIVPRGSLVRSNGIYSTIGNIIQLLSPILGATMIVILPIWAIFMIDVGTAAIAIVIMLALPLPHQKTGDVANAFGVNKQGADFDWGFPSGAVEAEQIADFASVEEGLEAEDSSRIGEFKAGLQYINGKPFIKKLMTVYAMFMILLAPIATLLPLFIRRHFGLEVWYVTAAQIALFAGMALGGLLVAAKGEFKSRVRTIRAVGIVLALLTMTLATLGITNVNIFVFFAMILLLSGLAVPFYTTTINVLLQENVDKSFHGRVFAVLYMIGSAAIPLGTIIFAPLADVIQIEFVLFLTGSLQFLILLWSWKKIPLDL